VFCESLDKWLSINNYQDLLNWTENGNSIAANSIRKIHDNNWSAKGLTHCEALPPLEEKELYDAFNAEHAQNFIAQPKWKNICRETTCLTRQHQEPLIQALYKEFNNSLITRWVARLVELANIPKQLSHLLQQIHQANGYAVSIEPSKDSVGLAQVEAARGRLIHHVKIENKLISHYQILAPTEWNFHPQGLLMQSLKSLIDNHPKNDLEQLSHLMINAIDPCVGYQLRIH